MNKALSIIFGLVLIVGGVFLFNEPVVTLLTSGLLLGAISLIRGFSWISLYSRIKEFTGQKSWFSIIYGILLVLLGIIFIIKLDFSATIFVTLIAFWLLFDGIFGLFISKYKYKSSRTISVILNILLIILSIFLIFNPYVTILTVANIISISLILDGIALMIFGGF